MRTYCLLFSIFAASIGTTSSSSALSPKRFDGDQVLRLVPSNPEQAQFLMAVSVSMSADDFDFWTLPSTNVGHPVNVRVAAHLLPQFTAQLRSLGLPYTVAIQDVQQVIDDADAESAKKNAINLWRTRGKSLRSVVRRFADYDEIVAWLDEQCRQFKALATCHTLGLSFENRTIRYIRLSSGANKRAIFIEAGMHAREWLSPATAVYIIDKLLRSNIGTSMRYLLDAVDWYIVPVANPDGYQYSKQQNRMWRKTRSKRPDGLDCYGVDANRNFDFHWSRYGSSNSRCSDLFHGSSAFSEPETKAIADFILANQHKLLAFFSLHAYSQFWLVPFGHREDESPEDLAELMRVALIGTNALKKVAVSLNNNNDTMDSEWLCGNSLTLLQYAVSGSSMDWAKAVAHIPYTYALELRPVDKMNHNGFIARESDIEKSGIEVIGGLNSAVRAMLEKYDPPPPPGVRRNGTAMHHHSNEAEKRSIASKLAYAFGSLTSWLVSIFRR